VVWGGKGRPCRSMNRLTVFRHFPAKRQCGIFRLASFDRFKKKRRRFRAPFVVF